MNNVAIEVESDPTYAEVMEASRRAKRNQQQTGLYLLHEKLLKPPTSKPSVVLQETGTTALLTARELTTGAYHSFII